MGYMKSRRKKERAESPFIRLSSDMLLEGKEWKQLSPKAKLLYIHLKSKYRGYNNGEIRLTYSELKGIRGISSPKTISDALEELEKKGWIKWEEKGGLYRHYNLYKLTFKYDEFR